MYLYMQKYSLIYGMICKYLMKGMLDVLVYNNYYIININIYKVLTDKKNIKITVVKAI